MSTETKTEEQTARKGTLDQWPPKAHFVRREDLPVREGSYALCGKKLMGLELDGSVKKATCARCTQIMERLMAKRKPDEE